MGDNSRREFIKRAGKASVVVAGAGALFAGTDNFHKRGSGSTSGVVVGQSRKEEITYQKTKSWEEYYKSAL